ncbi:MAG: extracellular solute-binding protein [Alphaproteobacteria bacterium]
MKRIFACIAAALLLAAPAMAADPEPRHGLSVFGDLKYGPGFRHFDYVNPDAPKGGAIKIPGLDTFETIHPFILKGRKELLAEALLYDTLMARSTDEPDSYYGLVAQTVEVPDDKSWVAFNIDPRARFHDGSKITAGDIVFTFNALTKDGHPRYRINFRDVAAVEATSPSRVKFTFKPGIHRDLPTRLAALPVLSKAYYDTVDFKKTSFEPALASGPYKVGKFEPGRSITYARAENYWANDLPVIRGRYNFDTVTVEYYRDREIAFQAFFSNQYDYREEFTSRQWAIQYDKPPVNNGLIVRETLPDETPSGVQAFILNLRRTKFQDIRVRAAMDLAFDYEWTNRTLFYGLYDRTNSMFENSSLAAKQAPSEAELALLEPFRGMVPDEVFTTPFAAPVNDGTGRIRGNLRKASRLLKQAGYAVKDGVLLDRTGQPLTVEFLLFESSFKRIINPYIRNLKRLGIQAGIRIVDVANFKRRQDSFDFDVVIRRIAQPLTPGLEQRNYFGSEFADVPGSFNIGGVKNPAVDALIEKVVTAKTRDELIVATHALDRVLMWNRYVVTQWYKGAHNVAYWNKYNRPATPPKFDTGVIDTWWYDAKKAALLEDGVAPPPPPGALPPPNAN